MKARTGRTDEGRTRARKETARTPSKNGHRGEEGPFLQELLEALQEVKRGDFRVRLPDRDPGIAGRVAAAFNDCVELIDATTHDIDRVSRLVGREGRMSERMALPGPVGSWEANVSAINGLIDDLIRPMTEIARVIEAVARGDLSQKVALSIEGRPVKGEFLRVGKAVNAMVDQLSAFGAEVSRVAREVGTDGKLGGQARVRGLSGRWKDLTDNVNLMASNLTAQVRDIAQVATAVARGDLSQKITVDVRGEILELKDTINTMVDQLSSFADEVTRVAREVGTEGKLGGQAVVKGVSGRWKDLTDTVNLMASNLTSQVRNIAQVAGAVARGDLSQKITVGAMGEVAALADTINSMTDTLRVFGDEVTRVAREVGTEGRLGGQARVPGVAGTWKDLTENVNFMASNLTDQVRNIAQVATAVAKGDLSQKVTADVRGEILELKDTINTMVDQLSSFADEVTRVAREVGTEGNLGGQALVKGVSGTWKDLTDNVNSMASNLTSQVRDIARVTTAVAKGDLSQKITVDVKGEILELKDTINTMVDQLSSFADEVTRVAREVGTDGKLGGQAHVPGVSGTWKDLTDNVNSMAGNLTGQVRNIAQVATAVARGDLSQKVTVDVHGEILELKATINTMVDQLSSFAGEVTRVAHEVGTEGKLGGQAKVEGVSGTWRQLTESVNQLAQNLTTQVRAIADVATAVTQGDLTRTIDVETRGEVAELKNDINFMIRNLRETIQKNAEQDWLKTNLARISGLMQGQRDLRELSRLVMSEVTPLVSAQHGAFFMAGKEDSVLRLIASYAFESSMESPNQIAFGEGLVGQAAVEKKRIMVTHPPENYVRISSGIGEGSPAAIVVLPVVFEGNVLAVIELASFQPFTEVSLTFLDQLVETIGVVLNGVTANMRTQELLSESQRLTQELQSRSMELQHGQERLRQTNAELEEKARQLEEQNRNIELKNREIEIARRGLEEKAHQLALASKYKSDFLANMSHELRTPLNSLMVLAQLLASNPDGTLSPKQVEFATTIYDSGRDLLDLINDILDLSKVEAGRLDITPADVTVEEIRDSIEQGFGPLADQKALSLKVSIGAETPPSFETDPQRLQQILNNLLSNALKFTNQGGVTIRIDRAPDGLAFSTPQLEHADTVLSLTVSDTGIGIAPDQLDSIFEAFHQADGTTSRRFGGTGLGLSISREVARLLGGEIRVESSVDEGSMFTLYLPRTYTPVEPLPREAPRPVQDGGEPESISAGDGSGPAVQASPAAVGVLLGGPDRGVGREFVESLGELDEVTLGAGEDEMDLLAGRQILIVDDDVRNVFALTNALESRGSTVLFAENGRDAVDVLYRNPDIDLILMDIMMPDMDGYETMRTIRGASQFTELPIIALTAKAMKGDREKTMAAGATDYIAKPVKVDELLAKIRACLYA